MMGREMLRVTRPGGLVVLSYTVWLGPFGGHETGPWHYLGGEYAARRYRRRHGKEPKNRFGDSLFPIGARDGIRLGPFAAGRTVTGGVPAVPPTVGVVAGAGAGRTGGGGEQSGAGAVTRGAAMTAIALDIGGSKIAAARVDSDGAPGEVTTVATPAVGVWPAVAGLLRSVGGTRVTRVGISSPGPVDLGAGSVAPINIAEWRDGFALVEAVSQECGGALVRLGGDGGCAALGESVFGAGRGVPDLLGVVVSTGIGGGVVLDGRLVAGRSGNAGHVGHVVVPGGEDAVCVRRRRVPRDGRERTGGGAVGPGAPVAGARRTGSWPPTPHPATRPPWPRSPGPARRSARRWPVRPRRWTSDSSSSVAGLRNPVHHCGIRCVHRSPGMPGYGSWRTCRCCPPASAPQPASPVRRCWRGRDSNAPNRCPRSRSRIAWPRGRSTRTVRC